MKNIKIETEYIKLDQFLKWADLVPTGTESRILISEEQIKVNGEIETRRGKKLRKGDIIEVENNQYKIVN
ncbi:S4 domain-containing protein YaaA [Herbivorax sp. ANBcel31]|uniref:S4 domain-containing protein YaaA n=1 Tax=Herbivorax sp. ANBcel31 TaxID=3069754 RepID=UPI0027ADC379|nr:S4 domain-containing protein YaaA [Herbivorax sp. ANBcel31]MDQ2086018.1 S4 domain-containing protein YaaA [Herbivorax sp. ANBcel31]